MDKSFQLHIDGEFCDAENSAAFGSIDPSTGVARTQMPKASTADMNRAVAAAHAAFIEGSWPALNATERGKLPYRLANLVTRDAVIIAELEIRDTGKILRETMAATGYVAEFYRYFAGLADKIEGATLPIDKPNLEVPTRREPIGLVTVVVPWNSQMFLTASKLGPALATGNTVIVKASEDGPAPLLHFAKLIHEAGFPKGVVNVITDFGADCGRGVHPELRKEPTGSPKISGQGLFG